MDEQRGDPGRRPASWGLVVLVAHVLIAPFGFDDPTSVLAIVTQATFFALLAVILIGVAAHRAQLVTSLALVAIATCIRFFGPLEARALQVVADIAFVSCGALVMWRSIALILGASGVSSVLITASIGLYLLAGITWAIAYHAISVWSPGSFAMGGAPASATPADLYFFSFVTLTTLGYGDISPVQPFARSLAVLQTVFGQIFLVALLGRLVSIQVAAIQPGEVRID